MLLIKVIAGITFTISANRGPGAWIRPHCRCFLLRIGGDIAGALEGCVILAFYRRIGAMLDDRK